MSITFFVNQKKGKEKPPEQTVAADELDGLGLTINLQDCYEEFAERAKVLPFVRPTKSKD